MNGALPLTWRAITEWRRPRVNGNGALEHNAKMPKGNIVGEVSFEDQIWRIWFRRRDGEWLNLVIEAPHEPRLRSRGHAPRKKWFWLSWNGKRFARNSDFKKLHARHMAVQRHLEKWLGEQYDRLFVAGALGCSDALLPD